MSAYWRETTAAAHQGLTAPTGSYRELAAEAERMGDRNMAAYYRYCAGVSALRDEVHLEYVDLMLASPGAREKVGSLLWAVGPFGREFTAPRCAAADLTELAKAAKAREHREEIERVQNIIVGVWLSLPDDKRTFERAAEVLNDGTPRKKGSVGISRITVSRWFDAFAERFVTPTAVYLPPGITSEQYLDIVCLGSMASYQISDWLWQRLGGAKRRDIATLIESGELFAFLEEFPDSIKRPHITPAAEIKLLQRMLKAARASQPKRAFPTLASPISMRTQSAAQKASSPLQGHHHAVRSHRQSARHVTE